MPQGWTDLVLRGGAVGFMAVCFAAVVSLAGKHFFGTPKPGQYRMAVTFMVFTLLLAAFAAATELLKERQSDQARQVLTKIDGEVGKLNNSLMEKWCIEVKKMPDGLVRDGIATLISTMKTSIEAIAKLVGNNSTTPNGLLPDCPSIPPAATHDAQH